LRFGAIADIDRNVATCPHPIVVGIHRIAYLQFSGNRRDRKATSGTQSAGANNSSSRQRNLKD